MLRIGSLALSLIVVTPPGGAAAEADAGDPSARAGPETTGGAFGPSAVVATASPADTTLPLDSLLRAHSHPLSARDGRLAGPGHELLMDAARGTRFFLLAENHYRAEIPRITSMLFADLHEREGYEYLATENGPYVMRRFSSREVRGDLEASLGLAVRYPSGLQFVSDEEVEMFARVGAISTAPDDPLWGLDRPFGGTHVLERLAAMAPDDEARRRVEGVLAEARRHERRRSPARETTRWIVEVTDEEELAGLRDALRPAAGFPADSMLDALELSHRTYRDFVEAERGAATGYASNRDREAFMKDQLAFHLRAAREAGEDPPRVLFKFGHWHAQRGRNPGNVFPLGGFADALARYHGAGAFSLATALVGDPEDATPPGDDYAPLAAAGDPEGWRVVDFRPVRPLVHAGRVDGVTPVLERWIFGFDAALLIGGSRAATFDRLLEVAGQGR